jgi:hypothetical protein
MATTKEALLKRALLVAGLIVSVPARFFPILAFLGRFCGDGILLAQPAMQIDAPAAVAAEGHGGGRFRLELLAAHGTTTRDHDYFLFLLSAVLVLSFFSLAALPLDWPLEEVLAGVLVEEVSPLAPFLYDSLR